MRATLRLITVCVAVWSADSTLAQEEQSVAAPSPSEIAAYDPQGVRALYRLEHQFDFDERGAGNFEDTPMNWQRLRGPGLPMYNRGNFDMNDGHDTPPCYRLSIESANVAYEYRATSITVVPYADYYVTGFIKPDQLLESRAFLTAHFVDRFGVLIEGSERVSNLVGSVREQADTWQRVQLDIPGEYPDASALRLQMWILQRHNWHERSPDEVDPILRRDTTASASFDDILVYSLPRAHIRFSYAGNVADHGEPVSITLEATNATTVELSADVEVTDVNGVTQHRDEVRIPIASDPSAFFEVGDAPAQRRANSRYDTRSNVRIDLPDLSPGLYTASVSLRGVDTQLLTRQLRFAILPELTAGHRLTPDMGVDAGEWTGDDLVGLRRLLVSLNAGAAKIGLRIPSNQSAIESSPAIAEVDNLQRELARHGIDTTAILLPPRNSGSARQSATLALEIEKHAGWRDRLHALLNRIGALFPTWQLGSESAELRMPAAWQPDRVRLVRSELERFITDPLIVVPQLATDPGGPTSDIASIQVSRDVPTRSIPRLLSFLNAQPEARRWVKLEPSSPQELSLARRLEESMQRVVLSKAMQPERLFVAAPFEPSSRSGRLAWEPNAAFIPLRTLFRYLSGKRAIAAMSPAPDAIAILFEGSDSNCMLAWTWAEQESTEPVELYIGPKPRAIDLWGKIVPFKYADGRTRMRLRRMPILIENLDAPPAMIQASYSVTPTTVQLHDPTPRPTLHFRNPYLTRMTGEVRFSAPPVWGVDPVNIQFSLEPGERFEQPLDLLLPPRQLAGSSVLGVQIAVHAPEQRKLTFNERINVGLREIQLDAAAYLDGNDLIVEQSLRNLSAEQVSFSAFCEPPGRSRAEGLFIDVGPGQVAMLSYVFRGGRELQGATVFIGIEEIRGPRAMHVLVKVPE